MRTKAKGVPDVPAGAWKGTTSGSLEPSTMVSSVKKADMDVPGGTKSKLAWGKRSPTLDSSATVMLSKPRLCRSPRLAKPSAPVRSTFVCVPSSGLVMLTRRCTPGSASPDLPSTYRRQPPAPADGPAPGPVAAPPSVDPPATYRKYTDFIRSVPSMPLTMVVCEAVRCCLAPVMAAVIVPCSVAVSLRRPLGTAMVRVVSLPSLSCTPLKSLLDDTPSPSVDSTVTRTSSSRDSGSGKGAAAPDGWWRRRARSATEALRWSFTSPSSSTYHAASSW